MHRLHQKADRAYYLHTFDVKQPDLNWRNPEVREAMYVMMRLWLDHGVDGFRLDVLSFLIKDNLLRDNPPNLAWKEGAPPYLRQKRLYSEDRPEVRAIVREMRSVVAEYGDGKVLIGEMYLPIKRLVAYYGERDATGALDGLHLPFNFGLITLWEAGGGWSAKSIKEYIDAYEAALPEEAWPNWVLGNHDAPRIATRLGGERGSRLAHMLLLTLRGTPTLYYGDEIGMENVPVPTLLAQDPQGLRSPGHSRDPYRTPMRWGDSPNAGFCPEGTEPWLPVGCDARVRNVAVQSDDPRSMLSLVRRLIRLRRELAALYVGSYRPLDAENDVFAYLRKHEKQRVLIALNFGSTSHRVDLSEARGRGEMLCSSHMDCEGNVALARLDLRPGEGVVVRLGSDGS